MTTTPSSPEPFTDSHFLTSHELAALIKVAPGTISNWRLRGAGPVVTRIEGAVRYSRSDVTEWLAQQRVQTPQAG